MKIIFINGSPRKNGATSKILALIESELKLNKNVEIETFHVSDLNIEFCKGCSNCYSTGKCFIKDDCEMLSEKIARADGVVIGSPTYASNISGQLKTIIDRGHFVIEQLLKNKQLLAVVTYENAGGIDAMKVLNKLLLYSGAAIRGKIAIKLPFNSQPNIKSKLKIKKYSKKLYQSIVKKNSPPVFQRIIQCIVFKVGIKPFVLHKGNKYNGVLKHWNDRGIKFE